MSRQIAKKTIILNVLKVLEECSSASQPITQQEIADRITATKIPCDRKTVGRNINDLIDFGHHIIKIKGGGCYMDKREDR